MDHETQKHIAVKRSTRKSSTLFHLPPIRSRSPCPRRFTPIQMYPTITQSMMMLPTYMITRPCGRAALAASRPEPVNDRTSMVTRSPQVCQALAIGAAAEAEACSGGEMLVAIYGFCVRRAWPTSYNEGLLLTVGAY